MTKESANALTWEEAVRWYRAQPDNQAAVRDNYFDLPVIQAANRYAQSEEFAEVLRLLGPGGGRTVLDFGAGNGIASFAFARSGWRVTALEPDPSDEVGAGAIRRLANEAGTPIEVMQGGGDRLPFPGAAFDAIHVRQALHHVPDLDQTMSELFRLLKSGGLMLATREHVVDDEAQLEAFRAQHPLHRLYGGENAYPLSRYLNSFARAGFLVKQVWGPLESILNFYPGVEAQRQNAIRGIAARRLPGLGYFLSGASRVTSLLVRQATRRDRTPGRLFSFLLGKK